MRARTPKFLAAVLLAAFVGAGALRLSGRLTPASDAQRPMVWKAAWTAFLRHPLLGTGPDTFEAAFRRHRSVEYVKLMGSERFQAHAHNDVLQALATTGLAGAGAYLALLAALCLAARRSLSEAGGRAETAALCGGLLGLFLVMKLDPIALEVLVTAAFLSGLLMRTPRDAPSVPLHPLLAASLALAAAASLAGGWRLIAADLPAHEGKAARPANSIKLVN
ncbi:MAG: O-antigen ligase family protein, partial [Elusimicrobiota bacterium]